MIPMSIFSMTNDLSYITRLFLFQMYGGTYSLFTGDLHKFGVSLKLVDSPTVDDVVPVLTAKTRLVWLEVCSNPLLKIMDIAKMVKAIKGFNPDIIICIDNTFLSPFIVVSLLTS